MDPLDSFISVKAGQFHLFLKGEFELVKEES